MEHSPLLPGTQTTKVSNKSMTVCKYVLYVAGTGVIAVAAFFTPIPAAAAAAFGIPAMEYAVSLFFGSVVVYFSDHLYKSLFKNSLGAVKKDLSTYDDHMDSNDGESSQQGSTRGPSSTGSCKIAEFGTFPKGSSLNGWTSTGPPDMYTSDVSVAPSPDQALEDVIIELNPGVVGNVPQQQQQHEQHQHREQQPSRPQPQQSQQDQQQDQQQRQHEQQQHHEQQPRQPQQPDTQATLSKREGGFPRHRSPSRGGNSNNNNNNSSNNHNSNDNSANFRGSYVDEIVF